MPSDQTLHRSQSVVAQAEARKRKNSIKKRMIQQLGKSIENLSGKDGRTKEQKSSVTENSAIELEGKVNPVIESTSAPRKNCESVSEVGLVHMASIKFRGKEKRKNQSVKKKDMIKNWQQNYEEMCDRAQKLDLAIKIAQSEELEVRPVNQFYSDQEKNEKWRHKMIAGGSFYSLHSADSSDTHVLEDVLYLDQCLTDKFSSLDYLPSIKTAKPKQFQKRSVSFHGFKKTD